MIIRICCTLLTAVLFAAPAWAQTTSQAQVMIVGVAHLVARRDIHNSQFQDSPLSPKRQAQIREVVNRLAAFHPTKVLIEAAMSNPVYAQRYRDYLAGKFTLGDNEIYQYGFRLAALSKNPEIYPIDTGGPSIYDENSAEGKKIDAYLESQLGSVKEPAFDAFVARAESLERTGTYLDVLRFLNTDAAIRANASWYSVVDGMGREAGDAGAVYTAQWYARNCYIFSNILSVVRPDDRVAVIMGQGHEYLLREFVRLNPNMQDVDPLQYL